MAKAGILFNLTRQAKAWRKTTITQNYDATILCL